mgnify:FL=1
MSSSMRNFMDAYSAVHSVEAKEEYYSQRDPISEMNTVSLTDNDLREISEEVCETLFANGTGVQEATEILSEILAEGENVGRNAKLTRLFGAFAETFNRILSKANKLEGFAEYRYSKRLQETWSVRHNQEKRVQRHHAALVAEDVAVIKKGLLGLFEKKKGDPCWDSHKQVGMKKKGGKMVPNCIPKNEEFVAEKKGSKPDYLDFDGDGDEKESMKKALTDKKKGGKKVEEGYKELPKNKMFRKAGNLGREAISTPIDPEKRQKAYDRSKKIVKTLNKANEEVSFSEAELKAFEEIVNSWED